MASIKNLLIRLGVIADDVDGPVERTTRGLGRVARQADDTERKLRALGDRFDSLGSAASRITSGIASFTGRLASAGVSLVTGAAQLAVLSAALASTAAGALSLAAALAPAAGALAALPGAAAGGIAVLLTLKLAFYSVGDAMKAAYDGDLKKFNEALEKLTPTARDFAQEFRATVPAMKEFQQAAQTGFFSQLNGSLAHFVDLLRSTQPAIQALAAELGAWAREFLEFITSARSVDQLNTILDATRAGLESLRRAIQPVLKGFLDLATVGAKWLSGLAPGIADAATRFGEFLSASADSGRALGWMEGAKDVFEALGGIAADFFGIITGIFRAIQTDGESGLGIIESLLDGIHQFVDSAEGQEVIATIFKALFEVGKALVPVIVALAEGLAAVAPTVAELARLIGPVLAEAIKAVTPALVALGPGLSAVFTALGQAVQALAPAMVPLAEAISQVLVAVAPLLPVIAKLAAEVIARLAPVLPRLAEAFVAIVTALTPLIPIAAQFVEKFAVILADTLIRLAPTLERVVTILASGLAEILLQLFVQLLPVIEKLAPYLPEMAQSVMDLLIALMPLLPPLFQLIMALEPLIPVAIDLIKLFTQIAKIVMPLLTTALKANEWATRLFFEAVKWLVDKVVGAFRWLYDTLVGHSIIPDLINGMTKWFRDGVRWIGDAVGWFASLPGKFADWFGRAKDSAVGRFNELVGWVRGLPGQILSALGNMGALLYNAGRDLVLGFWNGLVSLWNWLVSQVQNLFGGLAGWAKSILGIESPSKVFAAIGKQIPAGMAAGIEAAAGMVESAVAGLATDATLAVSGGGVGTAVTPSFAMSAPAVGTAGRGGTTITGDLVLTINGADLNFRNPTQATREIGIQLRDFLRKLDTEQG